MNQMQLLILQISPYGFIICFLAFAALIMALPKSAMVRLKAKWRKKGVLVTLCSDAGFEETLLMQADMGAGIFSQGVETYVFTPSPPYVTEEGAKKLDLNDDVKKNLDEALQTRMFTDTGKPHYIGCGGTGVATTPKMLQKIREVNRRAKEDRVKTIDLLDPKLLKTYLEMSFPPELMKIIRFKHEKIGEDKKPVSDAIKRFALPGGIFVLIIIVLYMFSKGQIKLPSILTGG